MHTGQHVSVLLSIIIFCDNSCLSFNAGHVKRHYFSL